MGDTFLESVLLKETPVMLNSLCCMPFDTGWIPSVLLLSWFIILNGMLPQLLFTVWWNLVWCSLEIIGMLITMFDLFVQDLECKAFQSFDYVGPFYNVISFVGLYMLLPICQPTCTSPHQYQWQHSSNCWHKNHCPRHTNPYSSGRSSCKGTKGCHKNVWWQGSHL